MNADSRLPALSDGHMTAEQRRVLKEILDGPRGSLDGPFQAWIHSPALADHAQRLGAFCRYATCLGSRLTELAILTTAAWWRSQAEWQIHAPIARAEGLSETVIEALRQGHEPVFELEDEALVYRIGIELYETRRVSDTLYHRATARFGESGVVELIGIFGYYALVAMTLNTFRIRRRDDEPLPFVESTE